MIFNNSKILITGASGFIGTNLVELFLKNKVQFINFDKNKPINPDHNSYWLNGNLLNKEDIYKALKDYQPTAIIHLAARTDCDSDDVNDYVDNTEGTKNLVDCIKEFESIEKVIITSTQYVYKSKSLPLPQNDDDYIPHTAYGKSKVITEKITREANLKCRWTIVRPTNVWGPWHMRYPVELWKMIAKGFYLHPGKKEVIRTYAYVKNVIHQINEILQAPKEKVHEQTFYLGDLPIDSFEWLNCISKEINHKNIKRIPLFVFAIPAMVGTVLRKFGIPFPLYNTRYNNMVEDYYAPTNVTIREFGAYNSELKINVMETVKWLKEFGKDYFPYWKKKFNN